MCAYLTLCDSAIVKVYLAMCHYCDVDNGIDLVFTILKFYLLANLTMVKGNIE